MILNKYRAKRFCALLCVCSVIAVFVCGGYGGLAADAVFSSSYKDTDSIAVRIDTSAEHREISPYIYGINAESSLSGLSVNALRQSNYRISSYNWENNYSNTGGQGGTNDLALVNGYPGVKQREPALYTENLITRATRYGIPARYVTLQMMGVVAGKNTPWEQVVFSKNNNYLSTPDTDDGVVYMDEYVSYLVNSYGYASEGGINGYFLGYEPENWITCFPDAISEPVSAEELVSRSAELAYSVSSIDRTAQLFGPSVSGIEAFINLKNVSDWEKHSNDYSWFIDYYLDGMKKESQKRGTRLLDVLDLHYHTEATNGLLKPIIDNDDALSNNVRLQATRILWDNSYTENSTIASMHTQHIPLIPTLEASIDMYYPGTKLSFSEYDFGGGGNISGGIAAADALGIFAGYGVYMACAKPDSEDISYIKSALNIYTNYDGEGADFGDTLVRSDNGGDTMSSVYAAIDRGNESALRILIMNKNQRSEKTADIYITSGAEFSEAEVYSFNEESPKIVKAEETIGVDNNVLTIEMEPLTVYMLVLNGSNDDIIVDDAPDTSVTEVSEGDPVTSENGVTEDTAGNTETSAVPENSGTTANPPQSGAEDTAGAVTDTDSIGEAAVTTLAGGSGNSFTETVSGGRTEVSPLPDEEIGEKRVPAVVKVIVSAMVAAVVFAMAYILVSDYLSRKNRQK